MEYKEVLTTVAAVIGLVFTYYKISLDKKKSDRELILKDIDILGKVSDSDFKERIEKQLEELAENTYPDRRVKHFWPGILGMTAYLACGFSGIYLLFKDNFLWVPLFIGCFVFLEVLKRSTYKEFFGKKAVFKVKRDHSKFIKPGARKPRRL